MRKRNGWCIWSPWSGYLSSTFAGTRTECIKVFERDSNSPWRRYREQGFECRPVLFVDARKESGDARWCERMRKFAALAALQREQWIPVSERLPPEGVDVLVLHDYGQIVGNPAHCDCGERYGYKITRRYGNGFLIEILETGQVTHWMPLPPAPQPEEAL